MGVDKLEVDEMKVDEMGSRLGGNKANKCLDVMVLCPCLSDRLFRKILLVLSIINFLSKTITIHAYLFISSNLPVLNDI